MMFFSRAFATRLLLAAIVAGAHGGCSEPERTPAADWTSGGASAAAANAWASGSFKSGDDDCSPSARGPVTFSMPSGTFEGSIEVELSTTEEQAEIRYTLDRTAPVASSTLYSDAPLTFSATTELRAQAFLGEEPIGAPAVAVYVARAFDEAHDLPVMILDSYGTALPVPAGSSGRPGPPAPVDRSFQDVAVLTLEGNALNALSQAPSVATAGAFHLRGQSSAAYAKRPYRLETRDGTSADRDCPMLGMPAESDWVLHSPYPDKTLIRNAFIYSLGPDVGIAAPRAKLVELYVNTEGRPLESRDYQGVYLLVETIKNHRNRLNLQQLETSDTELPTISGGYIFQFEWQVPDIEQRLGCPAGQANCWNWLEVSDPNPWTTPQREYLTRYLGLFVDALHWRTPADPNVGYPAYIDVASWVNQVIVHELSRNMDAYSRSQFFYKDREGKIVAGPLWDFDLIAGVGLQSGNFANTAVEGWQYESNATRLGGSMPGAAATADWFPLLIHERAFHSALVARWRELRQGALSDAEVNARIDRLTAGLAGGAQRNFRKWSILTTPRIGYFQTPAYPTWERHVEGMRAWLLARMAWLDGQW